MSVKEAYKAYVKRETFITKFSERCVRSAASVLPRSLYDEGKKSNIYMCIMFDRNSVYFHLNWYALISALLFVRLILEIK